MATKSNASSAASSAAESDAGSDQTGASSAKGEGYNAEFANTCLEMLPQDKSNTGKAGPSIPMEQAKKAAEELKKATEAAKGACVNTGPKTGRKLYVMRHAERVDRIFPTWAQLCFSDLGKYRPFDLNLPLVIPKRAQQDYFNDTPITEMGYVSSQMIGRGLRLNKVNIRDIYSSPALRCVQTANGICKALEKDISIKIEPGLFEYLRWYGQQPPIFLSPQDLSSQFKVDPCYQPIMPLDKLFANLREGSKQHFDRVASVTDQLLCKSQGPGAILIVGHGVNIDGCTRKLRGLQMEQLTEVEMDKMGIHYPYCAIVGLEEMKSGMWKPINNPIPPLTYLDFTNRINAQFYGRC